MGEGSGSGGRGEAAFPVEEEVSEHGDVVYAGTQHEVVDFFGAEDVAQSMGAGLSTGGVLFPNTWAARFDAEQFSGFCILYHDGTHVRQAFFDRIKRLHSDDVVLFCR